MIVRQQLEPVHLLREDASVLRCTYTTKLPFTFLGHPSCLTWRQLDEVLIRLYEGSLRVLENNLGIYRVRSTCNKSCGAQRQQYGGLHD
jgi:hypothetical protein